MTRAWLGPLAVLAGYATAFGSASLGTSLLVFDDHPGQLYRVWHVVAHGWAPWRWNDGWWAGYPELQFYPPGFAYAGALLHYASLALLPVEGAYQTLVWIAYLAPGLTAFLVLTRLLGNGWLALPGAFVALTLSAGLASGVEGGVHIGMVSARLGWSLLPLLAFVLEPWVARGARMSPVTAPLVAVLTITHPAHVPAAVALVALAAAGREGERRRWLPIALGALGLGAALTAFWSIPLLARLGETRALAWRGVAAAGILNLLLPGALLVLAAAELFTVLARARERDGRSLLDRVLGGSSFESVLAVYPWLMGLVLTLDLFAERIGIQWLPVNRVSDGFWMAVIIAAGLAVGRFVDSTAARLQAPRSLLAVVAVLALVGLSLAGNTLTLWPRARDWPKLDQTTRGLRLDRLWSTLAGASPGRVLFVRSGVPLVYGTEWYRAHTHITALTPKVTGRSIVNGTFTHPSPIAKLVYGGDAGRGAITELVEKLDGHTLFGQPLSALDAATFDSFANRLGVSVVVALDEDASDLRFVENHSAFARLHATAPFVVYARREPLVLPALQGPERLRLRAIGEAGSWASARMAYYPLWRASSGSTLLETRRGPLGDLEVQLSRADETIDLTYEPGAPEITGVVVSVLAALGYLVWAGVNRPPVSP